jgi:hypothetical protein
MPATQGLLEMSNKVEKLYKNAKPQTTTSPSNSRTN